jgi:hypothetical protein
VDLVKEFGEISQLGKKKKKKKNSENGGKKNTEMVGIL